MNILFTTSAAPKMSPFSTDEKRPPLGLGSLISIVRNEGYKVFFIDNYLKPSNFIEEGYLQRNNIDFVGIYANTICYRDTLRMVNEIEALRKKGLWDGKIILGGPHTSVALETIPVFVDYIVQGEGEKVIVDIVERKINQRVIRSKRIENLDELPSPSWDYFVNLPYDWSAPWGFVKEQPVFPLNTSRGCPFNCNFCSVNSIWGKQYTYFSAERIIKEIKSLVKKYEAKGVYFREDNFTLNKNRLIRFCELLLSENIPVKWVCETRVDTLNEELLKLMYKSGCRGLYIGIESGSQRILNFLKKEITVKQIKDVFSWCHKIGIKIYASCMVGIPIETKDDFQKTYKLIKEIKPDAINYNVFVGIPKSGLCEYIKGNYLYGYIDDRGLIYLKGHNRLVNKFYNGDYRRKVPSFKTYITIIFSYYFWRNLARSILPKPTIKILKRIKNEHF